MNPEIKQKILGGISYQHFLSEYWQQKPLLIRQAFDGSPVDISPEELAGIACDTDAPSRIVIEQGAEPWASLFGPFDNETFANLPDSHWTLLVNDLERYIPELRQIIRKFRFIPDWRLDDLMLSYAVEQGSVGPHIDDYDVFLIQTSGERKWRVDSRENHNKEILKDCSLRILKHFDSDNDWILKPGDMLYLPPNMPHYGISQSNNCMTLSVGFRAPSQRELIYNWVDSIGNSPEFNQRYHDEKRQFQHHSSEITAKDIEALSAIIEEGINTKKDTISHWIGKYLTETKGDSAVNQENKEDISKENKSSSLNYYRKSWLRLAYIKDKDKIHFFADGDHYTFETEEKEAILYLCENHTYSKSLIKKYYNLPSFKTVFNKLCQDGGIS
jgi:50S ribosomal protein L16 3-hydroxylase